jgi:hypothetical protein
MINEFIPYQQASQLKELGFDEPTTVWRQHGNGISGDVEGKRDYYNKKGNVYTSLPTYSQTFKFFRDKHELYYTIEGSKKEGFQYFVYTYEYEIKSEELFKTYEETELNCINKLIEIIKPK